MGRPSKKFAATEITTGQLIRVYTAKGPFTDKVLAVNTVTSPAVVILTLDVNGSPVDKAYMADEMIKVASTHVQDTDCTETKEDFPEDGSKLSCANGGAYWEHYSHPLLVEDELNDPF